MPKLGQLPTGPTSFISSSTEIDASKFTLAAQTTFSSLSICINTAVSSLKIRLAVYAVNGAVPGALLGYTSEWTGTSTAGQILTLDLTSPLTLAAGDYYLAAQSGGSGVPTFNAYSASGTQWKSQTYGATPPDPYPSSPTASTTKKLTIWANDQAGALVNVTQQYIEAAVAPPAPNVRVTQQYIEAAVLPPPSVSKAVAYAVLQPPDGPNISKAVVYAVLSTEVSVAVSKAVAYAVLAPPDAPPPGGKPFINLFF